MCVYMYMYITYIYIHTYIDLFIAASWCEPLGSGPGLCDGGPGWSSDTP